MKVAASNQVHLRNGFGQFISEMKAAATSSVEEAINEGAELSRSFAPSGRKDDARTEKLKDSIEPRMLSRTSGLWEATARHALPIEFGAGPHDIPADVSFFWEKMGRDWMAPNEYLFNTGFPGNDPIKHPGNAAQPYMRPAYNIISRKMMSILKHNYPG